MVVRRTPGKKIKIIHESTRDVLEITLLHVSSRSSIEVNFDYEPEEYSVGDGHLFLLNHTSEVDILHKSGEKMIVQVVDISHKEADIRLVDKNHYFRFEWSDRVL